ncbi:GatB/YqeY domain-containing protein [Janibacter sp. GXQ6167]|uniref:GatB/YqeY domain-containing protein n=1 Tax=Janibacter sp. GXQ6167 TaxID=3240791 RepID=UPI0035241BE1
MTDTLKETVQHDLHTAMRARDQVRAGTLRMVLTAITNEEVAGSTHRDLSDADVLKVIAKEGKKRKEAASAYRDADRPELAEKEEAELAVIEGYLPAQLDDAELARIVDGAVESLGATSMAQMGAVMKAVQTEVAGRADGGAIAALVKARLTR